MNAKNVSIKETKYAHFRSESQNQIIRLLSNAVKMKTSNKTAFVPMNVSQIVIIGLE